MALTAKRRLFVDEYLKCRNGAEAARRAGYAYPRRQAYRLLTNVDIKLLISERFAANALDADEVLSRLGEQARGEWTDYITTNDMGEPALDIEAMRRDGKLHLLKSITSGSRSGTKVEGYDAQAALSLIGKNLGLFKLQIAPVEIHVEHDARGALAQQLARQAAAIAAGGGDSEPDE